MNSIPITTNNKTKKNKLYLNKSSKQKLWSEFDIEVNKKEEDILECLDESYSDEQCYKCKSNLALSEEGYLTCTNKKCGITNTNILDYSSEWNNFPEDSHSGKSDPSRCGAPINEMLKEMSFSCQINCEGKTSYEMRKIHRYVLWSSIPYKEKSQYEQFQRIRTMAQISNIPLIIINDAIMYYKKISDYDQSFRGENKDGLIAASIYIACRTHNYQRTAKEIAVMFNLDNTCATKGCKNAQIIINQLEKDDEFSDKIHYNKTKPESFIDRYCSKLNMTAELSQLCKFICLIIDQQKMMHQNSPDSIASGIVYYISQIFKLNIEKKDIKNITEVSEVTINKCYRKLLDIDKNLLIPNEILQKYGIQ